MMTILIDTLLEQKVPNIITTLIGETNNIQKIFDDLKQEIENTKQPNAIKLINEDEIYDKIKNSKLPDNMKDELQILREDTYIRLTLENNNDQNRLFDNLKREIEMTEQENAIKLIQDGLCFKRLKIQDYHIIISENYRD